MGVASPVTASKIPVVPPIRLFLKQFVHAIASVHPGMIYRNINSVEQSFLQYISVLMTSHANIPPTAMAIKQENTAHIREFTRGMTKVEYTSPDANVLFQ